MLKAKQVPRRCLYCGDLASVRVRLVVKPETIVSEHRIP